MSKEDGANGAGWLRKNLGVVIAAGSLLLSIIGWYSSYSVLVYRVELQAKAIEALHQEVVSVADQIRKHHEDTSVHQNPIVQLDIMNRLTRIENLLIEHMRGREPSETLSHSQSKSQ